MESVLEGVITAAHMSRYILLPGSCYISNNELLWWCLLTAIELVKLCVVERLEAKDRGWQQLPSQPTVDDGDHWIQVVYHWCKCCQPSALACIYCVSQGAVWAAQVNTEWSQWLPQPYQLHEWSKVLTQNIAHPLDSTETAWFAEFFQQYRFCSRLQHLHSLPPSYSLHTKAPLS